MNQTAPPVTDGGSKSGVMEGPGSPAPNPTIPNRAMDATDDAIRKGERADIAIAVAAERKAWILYGTDLARQVIRETLEAIGSKP